MYRTLQFTNIISTELGPNKDLHSRTTIQIRGPYQHNCFIKDAWFFILAYKRELYVAVKMKWGIFVEDFPNIISAKFNPNCFRGEDWFYVGQSETRIACDGHLFVFVEDFINIISAKLWFYRRRFKYAKSIYRRHFKGGFILKVIIFWLE